MNLRANPIYPVRGTGTGRRQRSGRTRGLAVSLLLTILGPTLSNAAELLPATLTAWDQFTERAKARMNSRLDSRNHFLWVDEVSDRARRVRNGEILVTPAN